MLVRPIGCSALMFPERTEVCYRATNRQSGGVLPALGQLRTTMLAEQLTLLSTQATRLEHALQPTLIPTAEVQQLL